MICFAWRYCFCEVVHAVRNSCMIAYYGAACDVDVNVLKEFAGAFMIHDYYCYHCIFSRFIRLFVFIVIQVLNLLVYYMEDLLVLNFRFMWSTISFFIEGGSFPISTLCSRLVSVKLSVGAIVPWQVCKYSYMCGLHTPLQNDSWSMNVVNRLHLR